MLIFFFFESTLKLCKPLSKLYLPTLRQGSIEERTQWNKLKILHLLGFELRPSACRSYQLIYCASWQFPNLNHFKLQNSNSSLRFPSLCVGFISTCCFLSNSKSRILKNVIHYNSRNQNRNFKFLSYISSTVWYRLRTWCLSNTC